MNLARRVTSIASVFILLSTSSALGTISVAPLDVTELTDASDLVVHGRVERIRSERQQDRIFTTVDVAVFDAWKGSPNGASVRLRLYGGFHDGKHTWIMGGATLAPREEVVLFLAESGPPFYDIVGLAEGKFEVVADAGGRQRLRRDLSAIHFTRDDTPPPPTWLDQLRDRVLERNR